MRKPHAFSFLTSQQSPGTRAYDAANPFETVQTPTASGINRGKPVGAAEPGLQTAAAGQINTKTAVPPRAGNENMANNPRTNRTSSPSAGRRLSFPNSCPRAPTSTAGRDASRRKSLPPLPATNPGGNNPPSSPPTPPTAKPSNESPASTTASPPPPIWKFSPARPLTNHLPMKLSNPPGSCMQGTLKMQIRAR